MRSREVDLRAKVLADPQYRRCWPDVHSFMRRSRELRNRPRELLELQSDMASALTGAQESKRRLEREVAEDRSCDAGPLAVGIAVSKRLAHITKQIGDGIAWRALAYDRPVIRQLADKPQTGHMELDAAVKEFAAAAQHVEKTREVVVMNDLTNFLRYGDYTCVGPGRVTIAECKGGEAARKSRRAARQRWRLEEVLEFVNTGVRHTDGGPEMLLRQKVMARSHLATVSELITEARRSGAAQARLGPSLAVDVLHFGLLAEIRNPKTVASFFHDPFRETREKVTHDSLSLGLFQEFSANLAPYSIYPFSDEDCADIMTGMVWLVSYFSYRNLARCLKRRGLSVLLPADAQLRAYSKLSIGERRRAAEHLGITVSRRRGMCGLLLPFEATARIYVEFLDEESFADSAEEVLSRDDLFGQATRLRTGFANEAELWD